MKRINKGEAARQAKAINRGQASGSGRKRLNAQGVTRTYRNRRHAPRVRSGAFNPREMRARKRPLTPVSSFPNPVRINDAMKLSVLDAFRRSEGKRSVREIAELAGFSAMRRGAEGQRLAGTVVKSLRRSGLLERSGGRFRIPKARREAVDEMLENASLDPAYS